MQTVASKNALVSARHAPDHICKREAACWAWACLLEHVNSMRSEPFKSGSQAALRPRIHCAMCDQARKVRPRCWAIAGVMVKICDVNTRQRLQVLLLGFPFDESIDCARRTYLRQHINVIESESRAKIIFPALCHSAVLCADLLLGCEEEAIAGHLHTTCKDVIELLLRVRAAHPLELVM